MDLNKSDLLVIGAGPGGYELAAEAASCGLNVTLIERAELGGTCLNRGCIPTKALCRSAEVLDLVRNSSEFGIGVSGFTIDYGVAVQRKDEVVGQLGQGVAFLLSKVNLINGNAEFVDDHTVQVNNELFTADNIVIATGSEPASLPINGAEYALTSDDVLSMTALPESMAIIGGGVIGLEMAYILNSFGVKVTVLEYCKEILPQFDGDMAKRLRQLLSRKGIKFITSAKVTGIEPGHKVQYEAKGKMAEVDSEAVLMAVGRRPVVPSGIERTGINVTRRGIAVDESMQTSVRGVYAIGDVNGLCQLAHAAVAQGRTVLGSIMNTDSGVNLNIIPSAVFTVPEMAMVGIGEENAPEGEPITVHKGFYRANGKAMAMGETDGLVKIVTDEHGKLMGCQIMGAHASDLVQEVATAMSFGATLNDLKRVIHSHPTLSEILVSVK